MFLIQVKIFRQVHIRVYADTNQVMNSIGHGELQDLISDLYLDG